MGVHTVNLCISTVVIVKSKRTFASWVSKVRILVTMALCRPRILRNVTVEHGDRPQSALDEAGQGCVRTAAVLHSVVDCESC